MAPQDQRAQEHPSVPPHNVLPDLAIPVMALGFTVYYLTTITEVPWTSQASAVTVSGLLLLSIAAYALRTALRIRRGSETLAWPRRLQGRAVVVSIQRLVLLALTVGFVLALDTLGFTLATALFVFLAVVTLAGLARWRSALAVAVACAVLGYVVFIRVFQTRFPDGPVEHLLEGLF